MNMHYLKLLLIIVLIPATTITMESISHDYLIKEEHAQQRDDRKREIYVGKPLFMALCINAAHDTLRSKDTFKELLSRIENQTIEISEEATLTQKEFFAGLIAYVRSAHTVLEGSHGPLMAVIINEQKTFLQFGPNAWNPNNIKAMKFENMPVQELAVLTLQYKCVLAKHTPQAITSGEPK